MQYEIFMYVYRFLNLLFDSDPTDLEFHTDGHGHNVLGKLTGCVQSYRLTLENS